MSVTTDLIGKRVTVRKYGSWEDCGGIVRAVSIAQGEGEYVGRGPMSFHLLIETVSSDRKSGRTEPTRLFVADVSHDEVHVVPVTGDPTHDAPTGWTCPASSSECLIRQKCTNKCGKYDPKP